MSRNFTNPDGSVRVIQRGDTFVWVNGTPYNMEELGDIAQMNILDGLQAMMDRGWMGAWPPGYTICHYIQEHGFEGLLNILGVDSEDPPMVDDAHTVMCAYEDELGEQVRAGEPIRDDQREHLAQLMRDFRMLKKLSAE